MAHGFTKDEEGNVFYTVVQQPYAAGEAQAPSVQFAPTDGPSHEAATHALSAASSHEILGGASEKYRLRDRRSNRRVSTFESQGLQADPLTDELRENLFKASHRRRYRSRQPLQKVSSAEANCDEAELEESTVSFAGAPSAMFVPYAMCLALPITQWCGTAYCCPLRRRRRVHAQLALRGSPPLGHRPPARLFGMLEYDRCVVWQISVFLILLIERSHVFAVNKSMTPFHRSGSIADRCITGLSTA
jgi:hypothetical protein